MRDNLHNPNAKVVLEYQLKKLCKITRDKLTLDSVTFEYDDNPDDSKKGYKLSFSKPIHPKDNQVVLKTINELNQEMKKLGVELSARMVNVLGQLICVGIRIRCNEAFNKYLANLEQQLENSLYKADPGINNINNNAWLRLSFEEKFLLIKHWRYFSEPMKKFIVETVNANIPYQDPNLSVRYGADAKAEKCCIGMETPRIPVTLSGSNGTFCLFNLMRLDSCTMGQFENPVTREKCQLSQLQTNQSAFQVLRQAAHSTVAEKSLEQKSAANFPALKSLSVANRPVALGILTRSQKEELNSLLIQLQSMGILRGYRYDMEANKLSYPAEHASSPEFSKFFGASATNMHSNSIITVDFSLLLDALTQTIDPKARENLSKIFQFILNENFADFKPELQSHIAHCINSAFMNNPSVKSPEIWVSVTTIMGLNITANLLDLFSNPAGYYGIDNLEILKSMLDQIQPAKKPVDPYKNASAPSESIPSEQSIPKPSAPSLPLSQQWQQLWAELHPGASAPSMPLGEVEPDRGVRFSPSTKMF